MATGRTCGRSLCRRAGAGATARSAARASTLAFRALCGANAFGQLPDAGRSAAAVSLRAVHGFADVSVYRQRVSYSEAAPPSRPSDRAGQGTEGAVADRVVAEDDLHAAERNYPGTAGNSARGVAESPESDREIDDERGQNGYKERHIPACPGIVRAFLFRRNAHCGQDSLLAIRPQGTRLT